MAKLLGDRLPETVLRAFDGHDLEAKVGPAHLLVTVDPDGTPRPRMLSAGELLAPGRPRRSCGRSTATTWRPRSGRPTCSSRWTPTVPRGRACSAPASSWRPTT